MAFEVTQATSDITASVKNSILLNSIFGNPFYTSLSITILVIIIMAVLLDANEIAGAIFKIFLWVGLGITSFVFLHNKVILSQYQAKEVNETSSVVFDTPIAPVSFVPVQPQPYQMSTQTAPLAPPVQMSAPSMPYQQQQYNSPNRFG